MEEKDLIILFKSFARVDSLPLDSSEIWETKGEAEQYAATSPVAYGGQIVQVHENGVYVPYILQPIAGRATGFQLKSIDTTIDVSTLKEHVQFVDTLPTVGDTNILYILSPDNVGYIYSGGTYHEVFNQKALDDKAPINNPVFVGTVTLGGDPNTDLEAATKQYVDRLIDGLVNTAPGVVDSTHPLPTSGYRAGETWRVAEAGIYAGHTCEIGDLIICVADHVGAYRAASNDFIVVQANIDGAVTGPASATVGHIAVFDAVSGQKIADAGVTIQELEEKIVTQAKGYTDSKIGDIGEGTTIKEYIDNAIGSGGTSAAEAIAKAKEEAINTSKVYADSLLTLITF